MSPLEDAPVRLAALDVGVPGALPEVTDGSPTARRFAGKVCVVTGAAHGIGRATVLRLSAEGALVVAADRDLAGARETIGLTNSREHAAVRVDVRSAASVGRLAAAVERRHDRVDVLVNNAGIEIQGTVAEIDPPTWDEVMSVNLRGTYLVSRAFLPMLLARAQETGMTAIVNNASLMGQVSSRGLAAYCASKAGVISLTRSMALDHATQGLRVNCVCPGIIYTPMLERRFERGQDRRDTFLRPPVHYIGRAEDVAAAIAYLAADESRFVTGTALTIDGGVGAE
jgi:NAD(P)-dependent dehydrogenase (short-subunit alcohol dehydrogenase family)